MPSNNHYKTLGLKRGYKDTDIRTQYRKLALKCHPDKNRGNPNATATFQKILDAAEILSDPIKRHTYDCECFGTNWNAQIFDTDEYAAKPKKQPGCHPNNKFQPKPKSSRQKEKDRQQQKKTSGTRRWAPFTTAEDENKSSSEAGTTSEPESPAHEKDKKKSCTTKNSAEPHTKPCGTVKYQKAKCQREFAQRQTNYQSARVDDPSLSDLFTGLEFNEEDDPCRADDFYWYNITNEMVDDFSFTEKEDLNTDVVDAMHQHVANAEEAREREKKAHKDGTWESDFVRGCGMSLIGLWKRDWRGG
ncbi:hypothetical protein IFR05_003723 [Cadophora sp. M221]|nr:hypothetical protein IFR05_003723 [Cadophora sp. M221]